MRAALLAAPERIEIVERDAPRPGPDQVLVRVEGSSICGSDLSGYRGVNPRMRLPTVPGHEVAGTVVELGDAAPRDLLDAVVVVEPNVCCRTCEWCLDGLPNICPRYRVLGESGDLPGGLAEYVAVAADQVFRLPPGVTSHEGSIIQPLAISYHGVVNRSAVRAGEWVLILGAGPIGLAALLIAVDIGAHVVVADIVDDRLDLAKRLGAASTIRSDAGDVGEQMREVSGGRRADVTIEAVGGAQGQTLIDAVEATATRGRVVVMGSFAKPPVGLPAYTFKNREQTVMGSHGHPQTFAPVIELVGQGRLRPADLVTHTLPLDDVERAFRLLDTRAEGVVKVVLEPASR
jgi:2-desacetyl-2-hydroxyethyl bacteriochlorophyllide A dehydrogenase